MKLIVAASNNSDGRLSQISGSGSFSSGTRAQYVSQAQKQTSVSSSSGVFGGDGAATAAPINNDILRPKPLVSVYCSESGLRFVAILCKLSIA